MTKKVKDNIKTGGILFGVIFTLVMAFITVGKQSEVISQNTEKIKSNQELIIKNYDQNNKEHKLIVEKLTRIEQDVKWIKSYTENGIASSAE